MGEQWTQVDIFTSTEGVEPVGAMLLELGCGGFAIADAADFEAFLAGKQGHWDYIDDALMKLREAETTLTLYLPDNQQGRDSLLTLQAELRRLKALDEEGQWGRLEYALTGVREEDWAFGWKKYYTPVKVGERLVVCPSWEEYSPGNNEVVVRLDPGMAFGTGTHDSTRLCMRLLERYLPENARVLDMGAGSGILAVSALLLGARSALGVDIDEVAVRVARENAALNGVGGRARFLCGSLGDAVEAESRYELIFANIVADVILQFTPFAAERLAESGVFITSGIIDARAEEVEAGLLAAGLRILCREEAGGWVAFAATGKSAG